MEDNKNALDSFMNFKSEAVGSEVSVGGPSYLALIKSRYPTNVSMLLALTVRVARDEWVSFGY